jgi:hypothetical protein
MAREKMHTGEGGLLDAAKGLAGRFLGGEGQERWAAAREHFASLGLSGEHLQSLLPKLHEMLADKLPPHVMDQIREHVPGFGQEAAEEAETEEAKE